ncbi:hypothetical protein [Pirellula sp. SH-Sr6A]|uniref:hypothetical protein n=1 Tax=Pirellula sp. SH-Sr6A TaxID=1632865 RepID=UPI0011BA7643|nr:hypothetical protein [Pirellula sp. SH-Sr6A]
MKMPIDLLDVSNSIDTIPPAAPAGSYYRWESLGEELEKFQLKGQWVLRSKPKEGSVSRLCHHTRRSLKVWTTYIGNSLHHPIGMHRRVAWRRDADSKKMGTRRPNNRLIRRSRHGLFDVLRLALRPARSTFRRNKPNRRERDLYRSEVC